MVRVGGKFQTVQRIVPAVLEKQIHLLDQRVFSHNSLYMEKKKFSFKKKILLTAGLQHFFQILAFCVRMA